ncbi:N4bp2l1 [Scenedesmus sp. PABB004]|nr:N4bp2l1 [Scenedesmus sp. PABB004]
MRGLPGSGKSTRAAAIAAEAEARALAAGGPPAGAAPGGAPAPAPAAAAAVHSTDSYFIDASGAYVFNPELLGVNHGKCYDAYAASLAAGVGTVVLDNTNLQPWQYEKYVTAAWRRGYRVREEAVGEFTPDAAAVYAARNTHGVPLDKVLLMLDQALAGGLGGAAAPAAPRW